MSGRRKRGLLSPALAAVIWTACLGLAANGVSLAGEDPNQLRWDLARGFEFDWESVEVSAKVFKNDSPSANALTLAISMKVAILNGTGVVTIDVNRPAIFEVLDEGGQPVECLPAVSLPVRLYERDGWWWDSRGGHPSKEWHNGTLLVRLPTSTNRATPTSLSRVTGYIHVLYGDVVYVDVPFDARRGVWLDFAATPGLLFRVAPGTPPAPGPIPDEPAAIALYKYETQVKSQSGQPVMAVRDAWPWYPRDLFPFGEHAIVRVYLLDSQRNFAARPPREWEGVTGSPSGACARCWGQIEQGRYAYDMLRHVIVVDPVEVKVPFVLTDIPIPTLQPPGK